MKQKLADKILKALETNKLNPNRYFGNGKHWYNYHLVATELVWARNFCDGYNLDFYEIDEYQRKNHIARFKLDFEIDYDSHCGYYHKPRLQEN
ncbi:MAG: hypothetical protein LBN95_06560 [Prevotellaceae bacterium]|jgi:hypothetical protein|nr:hypothetical protein [Prevotellaceae bacterium]